VKGAIIKETYSLRLEDAVRKIGLQGTETNRCIAAPWTNIKRTTGKDVQWIHTHALLKELLLEDHCAARVIKLMPTAATATPVPPLLNLVALLDDAPVLDDVPGATASVHGEKPS